MLVNSMASYYELGTAASMNPTTSSFLQRPGNTSNNNTTIFANAATATVSPLLLSSSNAALSPEAKALAACKSHKEAERRRRKRINGHLATLRTLLPNLIKTDKASVLGEVVRRVRELKRATTELTADQSRADRSSDGDRCNKPCLLPGDTDEVKLCRTENDTTLLVATLCCEDRPELIVDLTRALRSVKGKVVRAEMATVGGRTKTVLWVRGVGGGGSGGGSGGGPEGLLRRALKVVVDKPCSSSYSSGMGLGLMASRMQRPY